MADEDVAAVAAQATTDRDVLAASSGVDAKVLAAGRMNNINLMWEVTQALIAVGLVGAVIVLSVRGQPIDEVLKAAMYIVLGFYYGRTNHSRPTPTRPLGDA